MNAVIFDLGTTNFKAAVFSPSLEVIAAASLPTPVRRAEANRSEIAPDAFLDAIRQLASRLREAAPQAWRQIARISFASQANTFLLIDPADRPLTPFIVWNDRRAAELPDLADRLKRVHDAGAYAQTGIPQLNCQFTPAKLIWLQQFESDAWRRTARVLLLADYLTWWLTGRHTAEASIAALSGLLDIHTLQWRRDALAELDVPLAWMGQPVRSGEPIGPILRRAADELALLEGCQVIAGCLDQYAGALGPGGFAPGYLTETTGTVLATVACADRFDSTLSATGVFQGPAPIPGCYFAMCFGDVAGVILETYRNQLPDQPTLPELDELASRLPAEQDTVKLDTQHWLTHREIRFVGGVEPTRAQAVRAIQRAVAEALAEQVRRIAPQATLIHAAGGAAQSESWLRLKSQIVGIPVVTTTPYPTLRGAARLALGL